MDRGPHRGIAPQARRQGGMMPRRPIIATLPDDVRRALDERLIETAYGRHEVTAAWLTNQGYPIGRSAVGNYAKGHLLPCHADEGRPAALLVLRGYQKAGTPLRDSPVPRHSQADAVLQALIAGQPVNQVAATENRWTLRLAAVIYRLRLLGWPIETSRRRGCGMADYRLKPGAPLPTEPIATKRKDPRAETPPSPSPRPEDAER